MADVPIDLSDETIASKSRRQLPAHPLRRCGDEWHIDRGTRPIMRLDGGQAFDHELLIWLEKGYAGTTPRGHRRSKKYPDDAQARDSGRSAERRQHVVVPERHHTCLDLIEE